MSSVIAKQTYKPLKELANSFQYFTNEHLFTNLNSWERRQ